MTFLRESRGRAGAGRHDDAARDQQGDVRRMRPPCPHRHPWFAPPPPDGRDRDRQPPRDGRRSWPAARAAPAVSAYATEPLPRRAPSCPALDGRRTSRTPAVVADALRARARARRPRGRRAASRWSCPTASRACRCCRSSRCRPRRARSRAADPLAGAEGHAVPDRGGAGHVTSPRQHGDGGRDARGRRRAARRDRAVRGRRRRRWASTPASSIWRASTS